MDWISNRSTQESLVILRGLAALCADQGGPVSARINELVQASNWKAVVNFDIEALYSNIEIRDAIMARQILGFFQKLEFIDIGEDRKANALKRFEESEEICFRTNHRLKDMKLYPSKTDTRMHQVFHLAQRKIAHILRELVDLETFDFSFGPGANTNVKGTHSNPRCKLSAALECSSNLSPTVGTFLAEVPNWTALHAHTSLENDVDIVQMRVVPGKVTFVPKNAKTDRSIVVEPLLNSFFQKGVGAYIRERLLHNGVDLKDGQRANQLKAMAGSYSGAFATVDLSMASDCLARELVWDLLPYDWANLLDSLRTSEVTLAGSVRRLEKFSSMGNGYTFELESMIFYAITTAVCELLGLDAGEVLVYGDDIIIPSDAFDFLEEALSFCGFKFNTAKSFKTGPFRESCGADFLHGFDIRPFYQKTLISERTLYTMHNWFIRHGEFELAAKIDQLCSRDLKLYGPDGFGDGHLIGSFSLRRNRQADRRGWCGGYFDTYSLSPKSFTRPMPGDAVLPTYSVYTRSGKDSPTDPNVVRGSCGYAKISIYTLSQNIFREIL